MQSALLLLLSYSSSGSVFPIDQSRRSTAVLARQASLTGTEIVVGLAELVEQDRAWMCIMREPLEHSTHFICGNLICDNGNLLLSVNRLTTTGECCNYRTKALDWPTFEPATFTGS